MRGKDELALLVLFSFFPLDKVLLVPPSHFPTTTPLPAALIAEFSVLPVHYCCGLKYQHTVIYPAGTNSPHFFVAFVSARTWSDFSFYLLCQASPWHPRFSVNAYQIESCSYSSTKNCTEDPILEVFQVTIVPSTEWVKSSGSLLWESVRIWILSGKYGEIRQVGPEDPTQPPYGFLAHSSHCTWNYTKVLFLPLSILRTNTVQI